MALFSNPKKTVIMVTVGLILFVAALALNKCHAAEWIDEGKHFLATSPVDAPYVEFDGGNTIIRGSTQLIGLYVTESADKILHKAFWQEELLLIGSSNWKGQSASNNMVIGGQFMAGLGRFDIGLGVSWMANYLPYNGQNVNFTPVLQYRFKKLPITIRYMHMSDAGMTSRNVGRDMVMLGWRF